MPAKTTFTLEADPAKVIAAITKLEEKVSHLEAKNRELRNSSNKHSSDATKGLGLAERAAGRLATNIMSAGLAFVSFDKALGVLKAIEERFDAIAKKSNEVGRSSKDLASQVSPEVAAAFRKQAADMGVNPDEALKYAGPFTAMFGEQGMMKAAPISNKLIKAGMTGENIVDIASAASAKDVDPVMALAAAGQAAKDSKLSPAGFGKAAPAWMEYRDLRTGMAMTAGLAKGGTAEGSLYDRTKDLALGINMKSALVEKAEKAAGGAEKYAALSETEKLAVLKNIIPDLNKDKKLSIREVMDAGMTEQQKAQSIAIATNELDFIRKEEAAVMKASPGAVDQIIKDQERDPTVKGANQADAAAAMAQWASSDGPVAQAARNRAMYNQRLGQQFMGAGSAFGWNTETGEADRFGQAIDFSRFVLSSVDPSYSGKPSLAGKAPEGAFWDVITGFFSPSSSPSPASGPGQAQVGGASAQQGAQGAAGEYLDVVKANTDALKENTEVTRENSKATPTGAEGPAAGPSRNRGV